MVHSFYIHKEATAVLVRPLHMSFSQAARRPFACWDHTGTVYSLD
jgi:hypothetical protein